MIRTRILLLMVAGMVAASCAPTAPPPPVVVPEGEDRFLIDPRTGYSGPIPEQIESRFETAWRHVLAGNESEAQRHLTDVLTRSPEFPPALLAQAALHIRAGRYDEAQALVDLVQTRVSGYTAARMYEAEIVLREGKTREAYELYTALTSDPNAPELARERTAELRARLVGDLLGAAETAPDTEAIRLLREALAIQEIADARILLARKLLALGEFEQARREIDPILDSSASLPEVQEILAEVDVGRGRYEEAIARFEILARRTREPRHRERLEEIKKEWSAANMPEHYRHARESTALTRADLATLLYWTVPSIRFAQNLAAPPIAVDIEDVAGREEIIRAIAIGLYEVDPVTRRVNPYRSVNASQLSNYLARLLTRRSATCARGAAGSVLSACGVSDPLATFGSQDPVSGRAAEEYLVQVAKALH